MTIIDLGETPRSFHLLLTFAPFLTLASGCFVCGFHFQLLQDYATIDEFGSEMLKEFDRELEARASETRDHGSHNEPSNLNRPQTGN
jgi:hypothetical protein